MFYYYELNHRKSVDTRNLKMLRATQSRIENCQSTYALEFGRTYLRERSSKWVKEFYINFVTSTYKSALKTVRSWCKRKVVRVKAVILVNIILQQKLCFPFKNINYYRTWRNTKKNIDSLLNSKFKNFTNFVNHLCIHVITFIYYKNP